MSGVFAPRTCSRCGRDYFVNSAPRSRRRHRMGVCDTCKQDPRQITAPPRQGDYSRIKPIADADDDTRPVWRYRTPTGVVILLPDDLEAMTKRLGHYFTNRFGSRPDVVFELDDDLQPSGRGMAVGPTSRRVYARFTMQRIETGAAV